MRILAYLSIAQLVEVMRDDRISHWLRQAAWQALCLRVRDGAAPE